MAWNQLARVISSVVVLSLSLFVPLAAAEPTSVPVAPVAVARSAPPSADDEKEALARVQLVYASRYAVKTPKGKAALARMIMRHAPAQRGTPAVEWVLLHEALRLGGESDEAEVVLLAIDRLAAMFSGVNVTEERRKALQHARSKPAVAALLTLLDMPDDARAAMVAGRWLAFSANRWDEALPLLRRIADEPALQAAAALDQPVAPPLPSAKAWAELAAKRRPGAGPRSAATPEQTGMRVRALALYRAALPALKGPDRQVADAAIADLEPQIPLAACDVDLVNLTAAQWDRLPYPIIPLVAKLDTTDVNLPLAAGEAVRVVPRPTDTWSFQVADSSKPLVTDWHGTEHIVNLILSGNTNGPSRVAVDLGLQGHPYGAVLMWVDPNHKLVAGIIAGPGRLMLGPASGHQSENGTSGSIRIKLVPLEDG